MKALIWAPLTAARGIAESSSTARHARPWGVQPANCIEKLAAVEVTATKTASPSRDRVCTLAPAAPSRSIMACGFWASNAAAAGAGLAVWAFAGGVFDAGAAASDNRAKGRTRHALRIIPDR